MDKSSRSGADAPCALRLARRYALRRRSHRLFSLSWRSIGVVAQCGTCLCHKFRAAALYEIAGFRKNCLEDIRELAQSGLTIDELGGRFNKIGIRLKLPCCAQRACSRFVFHTAWCHTTMLSFLASKCKGYLPVAGHAERPRQDAAVV